LRLRWRFQSQEVKTTEYRHDNSGSDWDDADIFEDDASQYWCWQKLKGRDACKATDSEKRGCCRRAKERHYNHQVIEEKWTPYKEITMVSNDGRTGGKRLKNTWAQAEGSLTVLSLLLYFCKTGVRPGAKVNTKV
jgi:hypothetical protein